AGGHEERVVLDFYAVGNAVGGGDDGLARRARERVVDAEVVANDGVLGRRRGAEAHQQQEAAFVVVAVVVLDLAVGGVGVDVVALPAEVMRPDAGNLVELHGGVIRIRPPDAFALRVARSGDALQAGSGDDVLLDHRALGAGDNDAVAVDVAERVVADGHPRAPAGVRAVAEHDADAPDVLHCVVGDVNVVVVAGRCGEHDAAGVVSVVVAAAGKATVHIVDVVIRNGDAGLQSGGVADHADAGTHAALVDVVAGGVIGDFQAVDGPILLVHQQHRNCSGSAAADAEIGAGDAAGIDDGTRPAAVGGQGDRRAGGARPAGRERDRLGPFLAGAEQDAVAGLEGGGVDVRQRVPRRCGAGPGVGVRAADRVDVVGGSGGVGRGHAGDDGENGDDTRGELARVPALRNGIHLLYPLLSLNFHHPQFARRVSTLRVPTGPELRYSVGDFMNTTRPAAANGRLIDHRSRINSSLQPAAAAQDGRSSLPLQPTPGGDRAGTRGRWVF